MSAERAALLAAVTASPDDTTPRLVYADWLDEYAGELSGDERAAVAAQAEIVRLRAAPDFDGLPESDARRYRCVRLERSFEKAWLANVPKFARAWVRVHDGLPLRLEITGKQFLKHGKRLRREVPYTAVRIRNCGGSLEAIINAGLLAGIHELDLSFNSFSDGEIGHLSRSPDVQAVRDLDVCHVPFTDAAADALARSVPLADIRKLNVWWCSPNVPKALGAAGHFRQLRELHIGNCGLDVPALRALLASPTADRLEAIQMSYNAIGAEAGEVLARAPRLARLQRLAIGNCQLQNAGLTALAGSPHLRALESLTLTANGLGPDGIGAFAASPVAAPVRSLDLENNSLTSDAMAALCANPAFRRLERLELGGVVFHPNNIGPAGVDSIVNASFAHTLRELDLYNNVQIEPDGARMIAEAESLRDLERLDLGQCGLGPDGGIAIGGAKHLANLQQIRLARNDLGPQGMKAVVAAPWLATMRDLNLSENLGGKVLEQLLDGPHLDRFDRLVIHGNRLTPAAVERFKARLGDRVET